VGLLVSSRFSSPLFSFRLLPWCFLSVWRKGLCPPLAALRSFDSWWDFPSPPFYFPYLRYWRLLFPARSLLCFPRAIPAWAHAMVLDLVVLLKSFPSKTWSRCVFTAWRRLFIPVVAVFFYSFHKLFSFWWAFFSPSFDIVDVFRRRTALFREISLLKRVNDRLPPKEPESFLSLSFLLDFAEFLSDFVSLLLSTPRLPFLIRKIFRRWCGVPFICDPDWPFFIACCLSFFFPCFFCPGSSHFFLS